jgi:uracil-DNA glycosylase family 4
MNPDQEKMVAEMGIGPLWKLRSNLDEKSVSLQALTSISIPSEPRIRSDFNGQAETGNSVNSLSNNAICPTCGWCQTTANATQVEKAIRPNFLFIHECNMDIESAPLSASTGAEEQLLNSILRELEIKRGVNAFVVSILKTKPVRVVAGQFNGIEAQIFACLSCVKKQIELISPSVIVSFGSVAANSLLNSEAETVIQDLRGRLHHYDKTPLIVTAELNYLLHQPKEKRSLWSDLCFAKSAIQIH